MTSDPSGVYFTKLSLENIRSFGELQSLNLTDEHGGPAQWTLLLGDNGVGKTTLLQCLTRMRPVFNPGSDDDEESRPKKVEPELNREEDNSVLKALLRTESEGTARISAELVVQGSFDGSAEVGERINTTFKIEQLNGAIKHAGGDGIATSETITEPLVLGYGAGRHMGVRNLERLDGGGSVESLFDVCAELLDAEELLYHLDYLRLKETPDAEALLKTLKRLLAEILPALNNPENIEIRGPRLSSSSQEDSGVWVKTPSGIVPFGQLSLGYQTVFAWTMDIAWRMLSHYPRSEHPLREPAIVIVDEIDLHLHPRWQRSIREHLTTHFPAIQFIATAHSPLIAQDALTGNLVVVQQDGNGQAVIENDPAIVKTWRLDQILTSDLFGLDSARPVQVEERLKRRANLVERTTLTQVEQEELAELDQEFAVIPTAETQADSKAMDIIRKAALLLKGQ